MKKLVMPIVALAAACLIAHGAWAAEKTWSPSNGGDMAVDANWGGVKPTSSDTITVNKNQSAPIWLSEDLTATGGNSQFAANFELALTNETGVSKTLSLNRIHLNGLSWTVRLTAGTLSFNNHLYMGDFSSSARDDTFIVDGSSTVLSGGSTSINVGSSYPGNALIVTNGATVSGSQLTVGRNNQMLGTAPNRFYATNELCRVTGIGTKADFSGLISIGSAGGNRLEIDDGALLSGARLFVGNNNYDSTKAATFSDASFAGGAVVVVSGGATLMLTNTTTSVDNNHSSSIGTYSMSNRLEIVDGGKLVAVTNAFRVGGINDISGFLAAHPGYGYSGNKMLVSGEGSGVIMRCGSQSGIWVGSKIAPDCSVTVENGATWESYGEFKVADGYVTNATLRVASGASLSHHVYSLNIGTSANAKNAALEIDDGSVESVDREINVKGEDSHISISGTNSHLSSPNDTITFFTGTRLEVAIPKDGFTGGEPPITCKTLTFNAGSSLVVTLEKANHPGGRVVLARATNNITTNNLSITLPDGVELDTSNAKELAVKIRSSGLIVICR